MPSGGIEGEPNRNVITTSGNSAWQAAQNPQQPQPGFPPTPFPQQPFPQFPQQPNFPQIPPFGGGSFFPGANLHPQSDRSDLLNQTDNIFYGGGNAPPTPTPTPTPSGPSSWWKFWNKNTPTPTPQFGMNQFTNFGQQYG